MVDPDDPPRVWTAEEANRAIERVSEVVERARAAAERLRARGQLLSDKARGNGFSKPGDEVAVVNGAVRELAADGIVLRDIEQGLVDFSAKAPNGRGYWLCWVVGEPEVAWWHWPEAGFAGRTPLAQPPG